MVRIKVVQPDKEGLLIVVFEPGQDSFIDPSGQEFWVLVKSGDIVDFSGALARRLAKDRDGRGVLSSEWLR